MLAGGWLGSAEGLRAAEPPTPCVPCAVRGSKPSAAGEQLGITSATFPLSRGEIRRGKPLAGR